MLAIGPVRIIGKKAVVICVHGNERGAGVAAILRSEGVDAEILEGGFAAWREAGLPDDRCDKLPSGTPGRTVWVTRARPKVDRIACPWLIRRFVDPSALFLSSRRPTSLESPSASARRRSTSTACSGAIAAKVHVRHDGRRIRPARI